MIIQNSRIVSKRSTVASEIPTVPTSSDHTDGSWTATDIYKGEFFKNLVDGKIYTRFDSGIKEILTESSVTVANIFLQGGNSFTATAVIGTNDAFDLNFETNGTARGGVGSTGKWMMGVTTPHTDTYFSSQSQGTDSTTNHFLFKNSTPFDILWLKDNGELVVRSTMANTTPTFTIKDNVDTTLFQVLANAGIVAPGSFLDATSAASFNPYVRAAFGPLGNQVIEYSGMLLRADIAGITGDRLNWKFGYLLDGGTVNLDWLNKQQVGNWNVTGDYGVGVATASARLHVIKTTEQLRVGYDTTNYWNATVSSTGSVTFDLTGTGPGFTFNKFVIINGTLATNANVNTANFAVTTIGSSGTTTQAELLFGGASQVRYRGISRGSTQTTATANDSYASWIFGSQGFTEAGSGTHALAAQVVFKAITITNGAATTTNSATVYIEGAATGATTNYALWVDSGTSRFDGSFNLADAVDFNLGTTTGTKIGTATSQKLSLWNATPIVQPTTAITAATFVANTSGIVDDTATFDGYTIGQIVKALRNIGALA